MPLDEALQRMLSGVAPVVTRQQLPLQSSLGRVLAQDQVSPLDVPGEDNSAMDGFALRAADATGPLPVSQRIAAGHVGAELAAGTAARIFTGAAIPPGADTVVMQENTRLEGDLLHIEGPVSAGSNIRPRGQDIAAGSRVLRRGRVLQPQDLGLLASIGLAEVPVYRRLKVAVLSTGDELVEPGAAGLQPGQLYNSNRYTLAGLLAGLGMEMIDGGIVRDDAQLTTDALSGAAARADCVITSGGVWVGEEDHVKAQVQRLGRLDLWKLAIKPGKPLAFGAIGDTPFIGLPGNPTSVFVTFCLVARPYLLQLQGAEAAPPLRLRARAGFATRRPGTRREFLRVRLSEGESGLEAVAFDNQSSGVLSSVSHSDALAIVPEGEVIGEGDDVEVLLLSRLTGAH